MTESHVIQLRLVSINNSSGWMKKARHWLTLSRCKGDKCSQILGSVCTGSDLLGGSVNHGGRGYELSASDINVQAYKSSSPMNRAQVVVKCRNQKGLNSKSRSQNGDLNVAVEDALP